ncbi:uncharacterized [Tachysurus ichikawai]
MLLHAVFHLALSVSPPPHAAFALLTIDRHSVKYVSVASAVDVAATAAEVEANEWSVRPRRFRRRWVRGDMG